MTAVTPQSAKSCAVRFCEVFGLNAFVAPVYRNDDHIGGLFCRSYLTADVVVVDIRNHNGRGRGFSQAICAVGVGQKGDFDVAGLQNADCVVILLVVIAADE